MNRLNFYNVVTVDEVPELDFLWNSLSDFEMRYAPAYYRVVGGDVMRPDLISYKCYGTSDFWWVIMLVNKIDNPLVDIVEGQVLTIPNQLDLYDFQREYRQRRSR